MLEPPGQPLSPSDIELLMLALMRIEAKLEAIQRLLEEDDDGEEEEEVDG